MDAINGELRGRGWGALKELFRSGMGWVVTAQQGDQKIDKSTAVCDMCMSCEVTKHG